MVRRLEEGGACRLVDGCEETGRALRFIRESKIKTVLVAPPLTLVLLLVLLVTVQLLLLVLVVVMMMMMRGKMMVVMVMVVVILLMMIMIGDHVVANVRHIAGYI